MQSKFQSVAVIGKAAKSKNTSAKSSASKYSTKQKKATTAPKLNFILKQSSTAKKDEILPLKLEDISLTSIALHNQKATMSPGIPNTATTKASASSPSKINYNSCGLGAGGGPGGMTLPSDSSRLTKKQLFKHFKDSFKPSEKVINQVELFERSYEHKPFWLEVVQCSNVILRLIVTYILSLNSTISGIIIIINEWFIII